MKFMPIMPGGFASLGDWLSFFLRADVPALELGPDKVASSPKTMDKCRPAGDSPSCLDASSADSSREEVGASVVSSSSILIFARAAKSISSSILPFTRKESVRESEQQSNTQWIQKIKRR
jgi:hypothetical protein